ncbi:Slp family lipoprotein [Candidatus Nitrospira nitrificans]|uniref:Putative Outer membrane lipoprotein, Slp family n=1 Tax=Candidatus Nitrospira nitrificans TaxID=1742973 RepID=A0A0S4LSW2_9BACT|nr:Slp family lipoprotein [Candidatus Nitrospira nitrificans]CUS39656.1 putative Outer membrane lipoprotein, Slp family [Candidatus Nitrospira nitrificans]
MNVSIVTMMSMAFLFVNGCNRADVIPERLEGKVDRDLRYSDIKSNPPAHKGKLMLAGGKVLTAKRMKDGTRIEVLQIPLSGDLMPTGRETESKGRFVVIDRGDQVADPTIFDDENKRITVVGEVLDTTTVTIDEVQEQVPQLALKHLTVWDWDRVKSGYVPYYGYGYPYGWGYRGYYGYPFYW